MFFPKSLAHDSVSNYDKKCVIQWSTSIMWCATGDPFGAVLDASCGRIAYILSQEDNQGH